ncbi:hypothetical protein BDZ97DRAFT_1828361 [Flammula alnicola]|nr:hypothetical protein BDZ97DRAFT_1828361 [Flammula alnicola]
MGTDIDPDAYNALPTIPTADANFKAQLRASNAIDDPSSLFSQLAGLFAEYPAYAVCLNHRHYPLYTGERMVAENNVTKPSLETASDIIPERWLITTNPDTAQSTFTAFEFKFADGTCFLGAPDQDFLRGFTNILRDNSIGFDVLGVCIAPQPGELPDGSVFWEKAGPGDREQVLQIVDRSIPPVQNSYQSVWVPSTDLKPKLACTHICTRCPP